MNNARHVLLAIPITLLLSLTACSDQESEIGARQTNFPGQVTAGGGTSGEVLARNGALKNNPDPSGTPGIPQGAGGNTGGAAMGGTTSATGGPTGSSKEGIRGQSTTGDASGTPSIPEGAGGNPSGAAMGGTTSGAAATQIAPVPGSPQAQQQTPVPELPQTPAPSGAAPQPKQ